MNDMQETPLGQLVELAERAHADGARWHFHSLATDCRFNPRAGSRAIVLEQPGIDRVRVAYAEEADIAPVVKRLAAMLHGEEMIGGEAPDESRFDEATRRLLARADELSAAGVRWHHHYFGADCALNPHAPRCCLVLEDPERGDNLEAVHRHEPRGPLAAIEQRYFGQGEAR